MRLKVYCKSCQKKISISEKASSRRELADKIGENFNKSCPKCGNIREYHVNNVTAEVSYLLAISLAIILFMFVWSLGYIMIIVGIIPAIAASKNSSNARAFNKYRLPYKY